MQSLDVYQQEIEGFIKEQTQQLSEPLNLYEPVTYILSLGGKRLRPALTLMAVEAFGGDYRKALPAAIAVEFFHNFSLMHDDIMDTAPLRRGKPSVHKKWDINTGILSGDGMLILAYKFFEDYKPELYKELVSLFSKTALKVCEGQQWDMDFEEMDDVKEEKYIHMIAYKTAVLVGCAMKMGALIAGTGQNSAENIYDFGLNLGLAFQLQDDYLDTYGDPESFGKQIGGDIIENKKTYLFIKAKELGGIKNKLKLEQLFSVRPTDPSDKIKQVKKIYRDSGADVITRKTIETYTQKAFSILEKTEISDENKMRLKIFGESLMNRSV